MPSDVRSGCFGILTLICRLADFTNTFRSLASVQPEDSSEDLPGPLQEVGPPDSCLSHVAGCPVMPCPLALACHTPAHKFPSAPDDMPSLLVLAWLSPPHCPCLSGPAHQPLSSFNPCLCLPKQVQAAVQTLAAALLAITLYSWSAAVPELLVTKTTVQLWNSCHRMLL